MDDRSLLTGVANSGSDQLKDEVKSVLEYLGPEKMGKNLNQAILAVCGRFLLGDRQLSLPSEKRRALQTLCTLLRTLNTVVLERTTKHQVEANLTKCTMTLALAELRDLSTGSDSCIIQLCDVLRQSLTLMEEIEREEWISSVKTECENSLGVEIFGEVLSEAALLKPEACLHILEVVLESVHSTCLQRSSEFEEDLKSPSNDLSPFINTCNMKLHQIFVKMVLGQNEGQRAHLLVVLIPLLVKVEGSAQLLRELWDALCGLDSDESGLRSLGTVCALADFFLPIDNTSLYLNRFPLVDRPKFWRLLQNGICALQPLARKQASYLLKRAIDQLVRSGKSINITEFEWDVSNASALQAAWQDLFLVLEALEESQSHLVRPVLSILSRLLNNHSNRISCVSLPWILCAFQRALLHPSQVIITWSIETLLGPDGHGVLAGKEAQTFSRFIFKSLLPSLNSPCLYTAESQIFKLFTEFLCLASRQTTAKTFFSQLLHTLTCLPWGPVPLFFSSEALSQVPPVRCWSSRDLKEMQKLVSVTLQTQSVMIRAATQSRLLMCMTHLCDPLQVDLPTICELLGAFSRDECFRRGTEAWLGVVRWLCKFVEGIDAVSWITDVSAKPIKSGLSIARLLVLLLDARKLDNLDVMEPVMESIKDCETRLYACQESQNFCLNLIAYLVQESEPHPINAEEDNTRQIVICFIKNILADCLSLSIVRVRSTHQMAEFHKILNFLSALEIILIDPVTLPLLASLNLEALLYAALEVLKSSLEKPPLQVLFAVSVFKSVAMVQEHSCLDHVRPIIVEAINVIFVSGQLTQPLISHRDSKLPQEQQELQGHLVSTHTQIIWELLSVSPEVIRDWNDSQILSSLDAAQEAIEFGGRLAVTPVLQSVKHILCKLPKNFHSRGIQLMEVCWNAVLDLRRNELFWPSLSAYVAALMQPELVLASGWATDYALQCGQDLFKIGDSVCGVANLLTCSLQVIARKSLKCFLQNPLSELIINALLFGPIHRKDQRAANDTCKFIKSLGERCAANSLIPFGDRSDAGVRACAIEIISRLSQKEPWMESAADLLVSGLLERDKAPDLRRARYFGDSQTHRCKNRILQALLILEPSVSNAQRKILAKWAKGNLIIENHQPSVRYQTEWLLVRILSSMPEELEDFFNIFCKDVDLRAGAVCSLIGVILHTAFMMETSCSLDSLQDIENYLHKAMGILVPFTMAQHFNVRLHAQVAILQLWRCVELLNLKSIHNLYSVVVQAVHTSLQQASGAGHTRHQHDFYFHAFHPSKHFTYKTIFEDLPRLANLTSDEWVSIDQLVLSGLRSHVSQIPLENTDGILKQFQPSPWVQRPSTGSPDTFEVEDGTMFQKKMIPWKWIDPVEDLVQSLPESLQQNKRIGKFSEPGQKPSLVVVASLIDKAPNQGGLARTCEIMGAALVLPSLSCAQDREFRALSMSAEMWIPMCEVKPHQLSQFLADMKSIGYTLVGAEQTAGSVPLNNTSFPPRTVLLLGNEREGVPANLLPLLDQCVEVPQCGVVRSLNVHVTGALFMWEYACQHFFKKEFSN